MDRVDNEGVYEMENCAPCCAMCNRMKHVETAEDFLTKACMIYQKWAAQIVAEQDQKMPAVRET